MSNLIDLWMCVCVCASGYRGTAVLQRQVPALETSIDLLHHPRNLSGENSVHHESCSVDVEPEHHYITLACGDVQGLSKLRSVADVGRNFIPVTEHRVSSSIFKTTNSDFCLTFQFR